MIDSFGPVCHKIDSQIIVQIESSSHRSDLDGYDGDEIVVHIRLKDQWVL